MTADEQALCAEVAFSVFMVDSNGVGELDE